jgi:hypothetical protein
MRKTAKGIAVLLCEFVRAEGRKPPPNTATTQRPGKFQSEVMQPASGPNREAEMQQNYERCLRRITNPMEHIALDRVIRELARLLGVPG